MRKNMFNLAKKAIAGCLAIGMLTAMVAVMPATVKAADDITVGEIVYSDDYTMSDYWSAQGSKVAPTKLGYVFGGWYEKTGDTEFEAVTALNDEAYAKFVPEYVLSVKAQNEAGTVASDDVTTEGSEDYTSIRIISSVDCKDYQYVGFSVLLNNKIVLTDNEGNALETTRVYTGLAVSGEAEPRTPQQLFGAASNFISVWRIDDIVDANDTKIINVRPYWITPDGTKVDGLAKYVHVEDGYNGYISVPINLITKEKIAAGMLELSCNDSNFEFYDFEEGLLFDEMDTNETANGLKMVGHSTTVNDNTHANNIYGSVRFKKVSGDFVAGKGEFLTFSVTGAQFCDWNEEFVNINETWSIKY